MVRTALPYQQHVPAELRFQYCPHCRGRLSRDVLNDDGIPRVHGSRCGWVYYPSNYLGVNVVVHVGDGVLVLLPPGEPADAPAALPGGHVEHGESPEQAAEAREETGLDVEILRCLGWWFDPDPSYPGPMVRFMFEARAAGGTLRGSQEGTSWVPGVTT